MRALGIPRATAASLQSISFAWPHIREYCYASRSRRRIVILSGAVTVLLSLRALKSKGSVSLPFHGLAWLSYCIALLAKQSAFAIPLVVAALLIIRPGEFDSRRRLP